MTTFPDPLASLIERVADATGPDREADVAIVEYLHPGCQWQSYAPNARKQWLFSADGQTVILFERDRAPHYTSSVDAVLSLARDARDALLIVHAMFKAFDDLRATLDDPFDKWPLVRRGLLAALRARQSMGRAEP